MRFRYALIFLLVIALLTSSSCTEARRPAGNGADNGSVPGKDDPPAVPTFDELYTVLRGSNKDLATKAEIAIKKNMEIFKEDLINKAALFDSVESPIALGLLGDTESDEIDELVRTALKSDNREIVIAGLTAVGVRIPDGVQEQLLEFTYSDDYGIRGNAATALSSFPEFKEGLLRLRELTEDDIPGVRMAAYSGIGKTNDTDSDRLLYDALVRESDFSSGGGQEGQFLYFILTTTFRNIINEEDCDWIVDGLDPGYVVQLRVTIIEALAKLKCSSGVDRLAAITRDSDEEDHLRFRAGFALSVIGDPKGYRAANDIYFATDSGLLEVNDSNFPYFSSIMNEYKGHLDSFEQTDVGE